MSKVLVGMLLLAGPAVAAATEFHYDSVAEGAALLTADDDYLRAMSASDPAVRLHAGQPQSVADLKKLYGAHVLAWTGAERARIDAVLHREKAVLDQLTGWLPAQVDFVLVSNDVEGGLPHTRGRAVVVPAPLIDSNTPLDRVIMHELFHVLSRNNAALHDQMYAILGFLPCRVVEPPAYAARRVTNPDAPLLAHYLPLDGSGAQGIVPYLYSASTVFDPQAGPGFEDQFRVGFIRVEVHPVDGRPTCAPPPAEKDPMHPLSDYQALIQRKTGGNTGYLIHPEETLAENFELLTVGSPKPVPSPWVLEKLAQFLHLAPATLPGLRP